CPDDRRSRSAENGGTNLESPNRYTFCVFLPERTLQQRVQSRTADRATVQHFCRANRHYFVSWTVWSSHVYNPAANERNWRSQSTGRVRCQCSRPTLAGFSEAGFGCYGYCLAHCLVRYESVVTGFCLQD